MTEYEETFWKGYGARPKTQKANPSEEDVIEKVKTFMPSHLKDKTFLDVLVIHGHKGERRHESLDEFVQQIEDEQVKVALFNKGEWGFTAKDYRQYITEDALNRCSLIFLFIDEYFIRDWVHISSTEPIGKLLYDINRKYRLIPILAIHPEKLDNRKLPMPLDSLTPLTYYRKDQQYLKNLRRILAKNKHKRKEAEENHKRIQEEWLRNNFNEYKDMPNTEEDGEWPNDKPSQSIPPGRNTYIYVEKAECVISGNGNKVKNVYFSPNTQEENEESQSHRPSTRFQHTDSTETGYHSMNFPDNGDESRDCGPYSTGVNEASLSTPVTPLDNIASLTDCMTQRNNSKETQQKFHSFTPTESTGQSRKMSTVHKERNQKCDEGQSNDIEKNESKGIRDEHKGRTSGTYPHSLHSNNVEENRSSMAPHVKLRSSITESRTGNLDWSILSGKEKETIYKPHHRDLEKSLAKVCHVQGFRSAADEQNANNSKDTRNGHGDDDETSPKMPVQGSERSTFWNEETLVKQVDTEENRLNENLNSMSNEQGGVPISLDPHCFDASFSNTESPSVSDGAIPISMNSSAFQSLHNANESTSRSDNEATSHPSSFNNDGGTGEASAMTSDSFPLTVELNSVDFQSLHTTTESSSGSNSDVSTYPSTTGSIPLSPHAIPINVDFTTIQNVHTSEERSLYNGSRVSLESCSTINSDGDPGVGFSITSDRGPLPVEVDLDSNPEIDGMSSSNFCNITKVPLLQSTTSKKEVEHNQCSNPVSYRPEYSTVHPNQMKRNLPFTTGKPMAAVRPTIKDEKKNDQP